MFFGRVAGNALKVHAVSGHMNIDAPRRIEERLFEIPVFDIIAASPKEVTCAAVGTKRFADVLCDEREVDRFIRITGAADCFDIRVAVVVTRKTIDITGIGKIEGRITPSVPDMTFVAALLAPGYADTKIIQYVLFADNTYSFPLDIFLPLPVPVGGFHNFFVPFGVA
jgi:hypothetical protein